MSKVHTNLKDATSSQSCTRIINKNNSNQSSINYRTR
jgi:hypothetical protein